MKRVLFIAYHFPPLAGGGTFRSLKFVKYLPEFGWLPTVITTNTKNYWAYEPTLLNEIPKKVKIIRAGEIDPFYLQVLLSKLGLSSLYRLIKDKLLIPDERVGWIPFAYLKAKKELKGNKYDLIYSTSPTPCAHLIALKLKKKFKIPWVCDFRDFWTLHTTYSFINTKREIFEKKLEYKILTESTALTTVSNGVKNVLKKNYLFLKDKKFHVIYNGFDNEKAVKRKGNKKIFSILYTGSFYGEYTPYQFLKALKKIVIDDPNFIELFSLKFVGNISKEIKNTINIFGLNRVKILPFMSQTKLIEDIKCSSILLLILPGKSHYKNYIPAKLFSYLVYDKPILAIIPSGEAKTILQKANLGYFANPNSVEDIKNQILNLYNLWKSNNLKPEPNIEYIKQFHRRNLTHQLVSVFNSVVD